MLKKDTLENKKALKWLLYSVAIFFIIAGLISAGLLYWEHKYENKIYPGVDIARSDVGGMNKEAARKIIMGKVDKMSQQGIDFKIKDTHITLTPTISSFNPDAAYSIYSFDIGKTINKAYQVGRSGSAWQNFKDKLKSFFQGRKIYMEHTLKKNEIKKILKDNFKKHEDPAQDAQLQIQFSKENDNIEFEITPEKAGEAIDYDQALKEMKNRIKKLDSTPSISLNIQKQKPKIYEKNSQDAPAKAKNLLKTAPLTIKHASSTKATTTKSTNEDPPKTDQWTIDKKQVAEWLALKKKEGEITIGVNKEQIKSYLQKNISSKIDQEPIDAKFKIENGKVSEFQDSKPGKKLNVQKTAKKLEDAILRKNGKKEIILEVDIVKSEYTTNKVNDLGINELLGTGHSNFAGSPRNRIHNIHVGANSIQGILIEPGEEFSLNQALGKVNRENGYLPELVIKENETKPEYGGGLCQIGTTMFRAALHSGLPITERQNHSYRVSYYEPPVGLDATIYKPHPDLQFINDTSDHVLIQSRIEGLNLYFDIWGTDDGRSVQISDPMVYGITQPQEPEIIETTELKPGERKCTESAHNGATAYFDYKVEYKDKEKKDQDRRFYSHYQPWRKRCLIGVEREKEETATSTTATSTESGEAEN